MAGTHPDHLGTWCFAADASQITSRDRAENSRAPPWGGEIHSRTVKIVLDAERCTGHGRCYSLAPELFDSDDEGHSVVLTPEVPAGLEAQARLAAENCPETCISLVEGE
jgi:ferredoxin